MDKIGTKRNYYCCCFCLVVLFVCLFLETCCWVFPLGVEGRYWCAICGPEEGGCYVGEGWVRLVMFNDADLKHCPLWLVGGLVVAVAVVVVFVVVGKRNICLIIC